MNSPRMQVDTVSLYLLAAIAWTMLEADTEEDALRIWRAIRGDYDKNTMVIGQTMPAAITVLLEHGLIAATGGATK